MKFLKGISLLILLALVFSHAFAQMDDKFYFPSKKWSSSIDSVNATPFVHLFEGDTVTSYFVPSVTKNAKATIIYFHGAGGNVSSYVRFIKPLLKDGYQLLMVDVRGYGKSSGKPTHVNIAADGQKVFDFALQQDRIRNTKVILYGASMGTQIATHLAAANEAKISGLILDGTIASFTDIALAYAPKEQHAMISQYLTSPYSAKEDIKSLTKIPVLFIHSKEEKEVPFSQYELVVANTTTKHETLIYAGKHLEAPLTSTAEFLKMVNALNKNFSK